MNDILSSISTIKNFMGNAGRNICNDYLYTALEDAIESMEYRVHKKCVKDSCPDHTINVQHVGKYIYQDISMDV